MNLKDCCFDRDFLVIMVVFFFFHKLFEDRISSLGTVLVDIFIMKIVSLVWIEKVLDKKGGRFINFSFIHSFIHYYC